VGVQDRLAAYFRRLGDRADDRTNFDAWAQYVEALPDDNEQVLAFGRAQTSVGDPAEVTPVCDHGLHLRLLRNQAPTEHLLGYIASLEGQPEPWVYGDWAKQASPPKRDGVPQWTVDIDVMVRGPDWDWPPEAEHPDAEPLTQYGWGEVWPTYEEHHLDARLELWVTDEQAALELTHRLVGAHFTRPYVIAHRVRARPTPGDWEDKPRKPEDLVGGVFTVPWQRADADGTTLTIAWRRRGEAFDHVTVTEQPDHVTITVHERFRPIWTEDGHPIAGAGPETFTLDTAHVQLGDPLGERRLLDGATGRAPDDLSIWQYQEKEARAQVLKSRLRLR
jgi:hypothetical protein